MLGGPRERSSFPPPSGGFTPPRCGLFLLRRSHALPRRCIELHGVQRTRLVLDSFAGIASTAVACHELGVNFTGFEIDPAYFDIAVRRLTELNQAEAQRGLFDAD